MSGMHRISGAAVMCAAAVMLAGCGAEVEDQAIDEILESALETTTPEAMASVSVSPTSSVVNPSASLASSVVTQEPTPAFFEENTVVHDIREALDLECDTEIADGDLTGNVNSLTCTEVEPNVVTQIVALGEETDVDELRQAFVGLPLTKATANEEDHEPFEIINDGTWVVFTQGEQRAEEFAAILDAEATAVELPETDPSESETATADVAS